MNLLVNLTLRYSCTTLDLINFIHFVRTEGRFSKQFDRSGNPSEVLNESNEDRFQNWRSVQELAGVI